MSEYDYEDGGGFDPVAVDEEPEFRVDREEWEAAQAQLGQVSELVDAVESQSRQERAAQLYAQRDEWLGDPMDDPAGYADRVQQLAQATAEERIAPFEQWFDAAAQDFALQQAETEADQMIAGHAERLGIELDAEAAKEVISEALDEAFKILVAAGETPEQAVALLITPERGREAIRLYAENVAHAQALRHGDETALVSKYFNGPRPEAPRPERAQYRDAQHRAVAEYALRGQ